MPISEVLKEWDKYISTLQGQDVQGRYNLDKLPHCRLFCHLHKVYWEVKYKKI
jgi:hypothetical protein